MPNGVVGPRPFDPALAASHLPSGLQQPGGTALAAILNLLGGTEQLPGFSPLAIPASAVWSGGGPPRLQSIGKEISDLLDRIFVPQEGSGLPRRLRLTNWDARQGNVQFHNASPGTKVGAPGFEATPKQIDQLINGGALDVEQPPVRAVSAIQSKIREVLDAAGKDLKDDAYRRGISRGNR